MSWKQSSQVHPVLMMIRKRNRSNKRIFSNNKCRHNNNSQYYNNNKCYLNNSSWRLGSNLNSFNLYLLFKIKGDSLQLVCYNSSLKLCRIRNKCHLLVYKFKCRILTRFHRVKKDQWWQFPTINNPKANFYSKVKDRQFKT